MMHMMLLLKLIILDQQSSQRERLLFETTTPECHNLGKGNIRALVQKLMFANFSLSICCTAGGTETPVARKVSRFHGRKTTTNQGAMQEKEVIFLHMR